MSSIHSKNRKTKSLLIYPKFQLVLILSGMTTLLISFAFVAIQSWRSLNTLRDMGKAVNLPESHSYYKFIDIQAHTLLTHIGIAFLFSLIVSTAIYLYLSHRLAGPIVRLHGYFNEIVESGTVKGNLKFRRGDFFQELPEKVNRALSALQSKR